MFPGNLRTKLVHNFGIRPRPGKGTHVFEIADRVAAEIRERALEIGGETYVVPLRSVSITRSRSIAALLQWNDLFFTWGPYETQMNIFTFDQYHLFHGTARVLPGFEQVPDKRSTAPQ